MSNYVPYSAESEVKWIKFIKELLDSLYTKGSLLQLILVIQFIYEFSVWKAHGSDVSSINLKDLKRVYSYEEWVTMCSVLYAIRGITVHRTFDIYRNIEALTALLSNPEFKKLLDYSFGEEASMFDEMLMTYSRWLYE